MLLSRNNIDYGEYSRHFPADLRRPTLDDFQKQVAFTKEAFGDYVAGSATFSEASVDHDRVVRQSYTVVYYWARFTDSSRVLVGIAFVRISDTTYVHAITFGSRFLFTTSGSDM
jgi:hypothetical protein